MARILRFKPTLSLPHPSCLVLRFIHRFSFVRIFETQIGFILSSVYALAVKFGSATEGLIKSSSEYLLRIELHLFFNDVLCVEDHSCNYQNQGSNEKNRFLRRHQMIPHLIQKIT